VSTRTAQVVSLSGLSPVFTAAEAGGDEFATSGRDFLHVKNGHTSPQTVTVNSQVPCNQGADHDVVVAVPNGEERLIGPFPKPRFDDPAEKVQISYSGVTALTIAIIRVP
jgi:hypothetical protein